MTKEIREYLVYLKTLTQHSALTEKERDSILIRIRFYQHERLVHLIVTMTIAVLTVGIFVIVLSNESLSLPLLVLFFLFLVLLISYLVHYYFLENAVQKMYTLFTVINERSNVTES